MHVLLLKQIQLSTKYLGFQMFVLTKAGALSKQVIKVKKSIQTKTPHTANITLHIRIYTFRHPAKCKG